ncbi:MAG: LrgB family protein [Ruminococcaceae bacterium]|nr:LrgB family protein [Oscillospiraceae bacterium]
MTEFFAESVYFGAVISILAYALGNAIQKKWKFAIFNPLLIAIILVIAVLLVLGVEYEDYNRGADYITWFLTPATVCFAVPLYEQYERLKKNWRGLLVGSVAGVVACLLSILLLSVLFRLSHEQYVSLLPKSITTAIGIALSGELGGIPTLTVASIMVTGLFGNIVARGVCRLFRIKEPAAVGLAIGAASHAIGTVRAREIGEEEGAISGLAIVICGILTVIASLFFAGLY